MPTDAILERSVGSGPDSKSQEAKHKPRLTRVEPCQDGLEKTEMVSHLCQWGQQGYETLFSPPVSDPDPVENRTLGRETELGTRTIRLAGKVVRC